MRTIRRLAACAALALVLTGCGRPDPTVILGKWHAETIKFASVGISMALDFEVTRNELILKLPDGSVIERLPLARIHAKGDTIELSFQGASDSVFSFGMSMTFVVQSTSQLALTLPLLRTEIIYSKVP